MNLLRHLIMRFVILILFFVATVHAQTTTSQPVVRPAFKPIFIDTIRTTRFPPHGRWQVGITAPGNYIDLSYHELPEDGWSVSAWSIMTPDGWKVHPGWFVFLESESRAWAYDGDRLLILVVEVPGKKGTYSGHFPCAVPKEVISRLSETAQKDIQKHK